MPREQQPHSLKQCAFGGLHCAFWGCAFRLWLSRADAWTEPSTAQLGLSSTATAQSDLKNKPGFSVPAPWLPEKTAGNNEGLLTKLEELQHISDRESTERHQQSSAAEAESSSLITSFLSASKSLNTTYLLRTLDLQTVTSGQRAHPFSAHIAVPTQDGFLYVDTTITTANISVLPQLHWWKNIVDSNLRELRSKAESHSMTQNSFRNAVIWQPRCFLKLRFHDPSFTP